MRRILIIANPIAGGGRGRAAAERLSAAIAQRGGVVETFFTGARGEARARAAAAGTAASTAAGPAAGAERFDVLAVVGGDGTVNEVLNGITDFDAMLGVLPMGTANVLAGELRLPRQPEPAAALLLEGRPTAVAFGLANGRRFLLFAGAGIDGAIVDRLEQVRRGRLGKHRWAGPILHVLRRWPRADLWVTADDGARTGPFRQVLVTRVRNYGGVFRLPAGSLAAGTLQVIGFRQRRRAAWALVALRGMLGRLRPGRDVECVTARRVRVDGDAPFQVDGDFGGRTPLLAEVAPQTLRLLGL